jgi:hypothetical protein
MSKRLALLSLILLLVALLALLLSGLVRELLVIPLLYLLFLMRVIFESIPQAVIWIGFLVIMAIVAWNSLAEPRPMPLAHQPPPASRAPVATWAAIFERAARDDYARQVLAQRLGQLAFDLLASQEQLPSQSLWQRLHDPSLDIPPEIQAYFQAGLQMRRSLPTFWKRWWSRGARHAPHADPLDLDPEQVVQLLEHRMFMEMRD